MVSEEKNPIQNVEDMDITDVTFNNNNIKYNDYVSTRNQKVKYVFNKQYRYVISRFKYQKQSSLI